MPHYPYPAAPAPLGLTEPHAGLLQQPPIGQVLYKIMSVENCISSIERGYLHFNRDDPPILAAEADAPFAARDAERLMDPGVIVHVVVDAVAPGVCPTVRFE